MSLHWPTCVMSFSILDFGSQQCHGSSARLVARQSRSNLQSEIQNPKCICRPRNRTEETGLMRASWAPAAPASICE
jgi:hypothetical protein